MSICPRWSAFAALGLLIVATTSSASETIRPANLRFADAEVKEVPDFQRHVLPLMGRLGCNGRACHGSFQGQGGFRLSLFGYDFKMDHEALLKKDASRVDPESPETSKILMKPTLSVPHKGGKRMEEGSWQYRLLEKWIDGGAKNASDSVRFVRLEVTPGEIVFKGEGERVNLRAVAEWSDGTREDVTCITRFRSNDESIADVNADGLVTSKGKGDTHVVAFYDNGVAVTQVLRPVSEQVGPSYPDVAAPTRIDELVVAKLRKLGIVPSETCTDQEFLRRVSLDMTGTLPVPAEVEAFLADSRPNKRDRKIDELLERPTYAAWWTNKLCDITSDSPRLLAGQVLVQDAARHWYDWIYQRVKDNTPYDRLVAGIVLATSRRPGQTYDDYIKEQSTYYRDKDRADYAKRDTMPYFWYRRNLRTPEEKALGFSHTFLGVRLECAQCHKHPFDQWTQDDFKQFTAFFTPVRFGIAPDGRELSRKMQEELRSKSKVAGEIQRMQTALAKEGKPIAWQEVFVDANAMKPRPANAKQKQAAQASNRVVTPKLLGGDVVTLSGRNDPREPLMEWMRRKDNPYFARSFVNRVWAVYFGSGIVNPPDDMNLANPPSNPALLEYLADGFISHEFDMKWLHREIVRSATYQRSRKSNPTNRQDERNFSRAVVRRIPAEVLIDALTLATAGKAEVAKFTATLDERAIGPVAGSGGNGRRGAGAYAARVFGRSTRETNCDCEASNEPNLLQSIYLQNDQEVFAAIDRKGGWLDERLGLSTRAQLNSQRNEANALKAMEKQASGLEKRLETLRDPKQEPQAKKVKEQLTKLRETLDARRKKLESAEKVQEPPAFEVDPVVRDAYERTLGRMPNQREAQLARDHFRDVGSNEKGLRDLLWVLLNTKEFVTNH